MFELGAVVITREKNENHTDISTDVSVADDMVMRLDVAQVYAGSSPIGHLKEREYGILQNKK